MVNPQRDMPRAIYISIPIVTTIYVLANVAYLSVVAPQEIKESNAVAVVSIRDVTSRLIRAPTELPIPPPSILL